MYCTKFCFFIPLRLGVVMLGYLQLMGGIFMVFTISEELFKIETETDQLRYGLDGLSPNGTAAVAIAAAIAETTWPEAYLQLQRCTWVLIALSSSFAIVAGHLEHSSLLRYYFFVLPIIYVVNTTLFIPIMVKSKVGQKYVISSLVYIASAIYFLLVMRCAYKTIQRQHKAVKNKRQGV